jgi:hypothetical protein
VPMRTSLHFTPDGVSRPRAVITINIAHLTEGRPQSSTLLKRCLLALHVPLDYETT